jgi:3-oxoacyl-[acyl-carrier protein] reductase
VKERPVALVTGANAVDGLGGSIALRLAERGHVVACTYRENSEGSAKLLRACEERGAADTLAVQADVADDIDCRATLAAVLERWQGLDVLVNNAAVTRPVPLQLIRMDAGRYLG